MEKNKKRTITWESERLDQLKDDVRERIKEVIPIDADEETKKRIISATIKIIIAVAALALILGWWSNRADYSCANISQCAKDTPKMMGGGSGFPLDITGSKTIDIKPIANGFCVVTDTSYTVHNTESKTVDIRPHYMSSPVVETSGRYALIYDAGGRNYRFETAAGTLAAGKTDYVITAGCVSRSGRYALLSYESQKLTMVDVRDINGKVIHKWHSDFYYITDAALSPNGDYIAMCGLNAKGGEMESVIIIQKVGEKKDVKRLVFKDNEFNSLGYTKSGVLMAVGDKSLLVISGNGKRTETVDYGDAQLLSYDICYDYGALVYLSDSASQSVGTLISVDSYANKKFKVNVEGKVLSISGSEDTASVLTRDKVFIYSDTGRLISDYDVGESGFDVLSIGNDAYVACATKIEKYS